MSFCSKCGYENKDQSALYCQRCGANLKNENTITILVKLVIIRRSDGAMAISAKVKSSFRLS